MTTESLKQRVTRLEAEVQELRAGLSANGHRSKDWRRTIGAFTDNPGMQGIFEEAMKLRKADRRKARRKPAKARRAKS